MGEVIGVALTLGVMWLVMVMPGVLAWRVGRGPSWGRAALALLGPGAAGYALMVVFWVFQYKGQCGGWLGESVACRWGQYAAETLFLAAMTLGVPGVVGLVVGGAVLAGRRSWVKR
ncbi:MAG: hypothetical protein ACK58M_20370 [Acidobacteriota bacterium]|jgi:hypothetical protein|nr:hypothetical protein [Bryobacteraceae bacterium CoA2 C42]